MNIEFQAPIGQIKEWIVSYTREQLIGLYHRDKSISRAQVTFRPWLDTQHAYKVCEIDLTINGHSLFIHRQGSSYGMAMRKAIAAVEKKIDEHAERRHESMRSGI